MTSSVGVAPTAGGAGLTSSPVVDVGQLANILTQARGPIIDRLSRALSKLSGDGNVAVTEWFSNLERLCGVERVEPADIIICSRAMPLEYIVE